MKASDATITIIDFESTGVVAGLPDEPWQVGVVRFEAGRVNPKDSITTLLQVGSRPFSRHAPGRHERLRDEISVAPVLAELWPQLRHWLVGCPLAAHNVSTEKKILSKAFPMHSVGPWIDTLTLARVAHPECASHRLEDLIIGFGLSGQVEQLAPQRAPHDALYDAISCGVLLEYLFGLPEWEDITLDALIHARADEFHKGLARRSGR
jgi:DNA polymerase III epsilon subunit-like protein